MCPFSVRVEQPYVRSFSWKLASAPSVLAVAFRSHHVFALRMVDLPAIRLPRLHPLFRPWAHLALSVTPSQLLKYRNLYLLSIGYAFRTYPERTNLPLETLGFRCVGFSPTFRYSHRHSLFHALHGSFRSRFFVHGTLPYHPLGSIASVVCLAPVYYRRRVIRLVSCYALFKGWLLLSQPPSCLDISTSFST